jgi:hypothetical protein
VHPVELGRPGWRRRRSPRWRPGLGAFVALGPLVLLIAVGRFSAFAYLIAREG